MAEFFRFKIQSFRDFFYVTCQLSRIYRRYFMIGEVKFTTLYNIDKFEIVTHFYMDIIIVTLIS